MDYGGGEHSDALNRLCDECAKIGIQIYDLKKGLASYDVSYKKKFEAVYKGMSYGATFNGASENLNLIDNMNVANEAVKERFRGIVLIFDEFGRYVEDYGESLKVKSIQDLAEYCDHCDFDNHLILVSHKQLSLYTDSMKKSVSDEWKKIEGRFKPTSLNAKYNQFSAFAGYGVQDSDLSFSLSLIENIIPKTEQWQIFKKANENALNNLYNQALQIKGFSLPQAVMPKEKNLFESAFPLNPVTLFALDRLSKKTAQNERTFFTYLAGDDENSLFSQLEKYDINEFHFIGLDKIYDYFEPNIKSFKTGESYAVYKKLQYALNKSAVNLNNDNYEYQARILKSLAVINIIADTDVISANRDTLLNATDGNREQIAHAVDFLEKQKIIKFMRRYEYYDFFDSSTFDIEGMAEDKISNISDETVINTLNEKFASFALYPYKYNESYFVNRVFIPVFAKKSDLTKKLS